MPQRIPLPFGKGMHHFRRLPRLQYIERHGALVAVEVVVQTAVAQHEKRRGNAGEFQRVRKIALKRIFCEFDRLLGGY